MLTTLFNQPRRIAATCTQSAHRASVALSVAFVAAAVAIQSGHTASVSVTERFVAQTVTQQAPHTSTAALTERFVVVATTTQRPHTTAVSDQEAFVAVATATQSPPSMAAAMVERFVANAAAQQQAATMAATLRETFAQAIASTQAPHTTSALLTNTPPVLGNPSFAIRAQQSPHTTSASFVETAPATNGAAWHGLLNRHLRARPQAKKSRRPSALPAAPVLIAPAVEITPAPTPESPQQTRVSFRVAATQAPHRTAMTCDVASQCGIASSQRSHRSAARLNAEPFADDEMALFSLLLTA